VRRRVTEIVQGRVARHGWRPEEIWYGRTALALALAPLAWLFHGVVALRQRAFASGLAAVAELPVPVVVVGAITVGGTGKTPLVIWLVRYLKDLGYRPGVVCCGYRGRARSWPQQVRADSDPVIVGDESVVLARRCGCPIAAGPDRVEAATALIEHYGCDIVVSDDGLQHYALGRDIEIAVIDGVRRFGNGRLLPAGPLREPVSRLHDVDLVVTNGIGARGEFSMRYVADGLVAVADETRRMALSQLANQTVHAVAGTGNPEHFFTLLRSQGLRVHKHPMPDHHAYREADLRFGDELPIIMTEKDAVKCRRLATPGAWYVPVTATLPSVFEHRLRALLEKTTHGQESP
jgi:tetraacyldisaccharide 4'-kinase